MVNLLENSPRHDFPAQIVTLSSGLTLIHQYLPETPVAVVDVWVRAGAIAETEGMGRHGPFLGTHDF